MSFIVDFIYKRGEFTRNALAHKFIKQITKKQRSQYNNHGVIPKPFFDWLVDIGIIQEKEVPFREDRIIGNLIDLLYFRIDTDGQRKVLIKKLADELPKESPLHWKIRKQLSSIDLERSRLMTKNKRPITNRIENLFSSSIT